MDSQKGLALANAALSAVLVETMEQLEQYKNWWSDKVAEMDKLAHENKQLRLALDNLSMQLRQDESPFEESAGGTEDTFR